MAKPKRSRKIRTPKSSTETDLNAALAALGPIAADPDGRIAWWRERTAIIDRHRRRSRMTDVEQQQETHSPTVEIAVDDPEATRKVRRNITRVRQAEAWRHNRLSGMQRDAEREVEFAYRALTHGLGASRMKMGIEPRGHYDFAIGRRGQRRRGLAGLVQGGAPPAHRAACLPRCAHGTEDPRLGRVGPQATARPGVRQLQPRAGPVGRTARMDAATTSAARRRGARLMPTRSPELLEQLHSAYVSSSLPVRSIAVLFQVPKEEISALAKEHGWPPRSDKTPAERAAAARAAEAARQADLYGDAVDDVRLLRRRGFVLCERASGTELGTCFAPWRHCGGTWRRSSKREVSRWQ